MRALTGSFGEAGFVTLTDDVIVSVPVLDGYLDNLRSRPLLFVQLTPALDVIRLRDAGRPKQVFEMWSHLDAPVAAVSLSR